MLRKALSKGRAGRRGYGVWWSKVEPTPAQSFHLACSWIIRDWGDFAKRDKPAAARRGDASGGVFLSGAVVLYYIEYQHAEVTGVTLLLVVYR